MSQRLKIEATSAGNFHSVGTIEANWVTNFKAIKGCYNQLIALMASYNTKRMLLTLRFPPLLWHLARTLIE